VRAIAVLPPQARPTCGHQLRAGPTDCGILFLPPSPLVGRGSWGVRRSSHATAYYYAEPADARRCGAAPLVPVAATCPKNPVTDKLSVRLRHGPSVTSLYNSSCYLQV
jgi:hypothetical protein